mmetsp:Transcript_94837/g.273015  ORF Transcript_94837/g.273015 Transcript_94837/m.273015 type:complete len:296 (+) Transcript_94837:1178-2065(+)
MMLNAHLAFLRRADLHFDEGQRLLRLESHGGQALDLLARGFRRLGARGVRVDRGSGLLASVGAPPDQAGELRRVVLQVVLDVGGDEVVGVVVALLHPERQHDALVRAGLFEELGPQLLLEEIVGGALVDEEAHRRPGVALHELDGVVLLPSLLVVAEVQGQGLLAPGDLHGVHDGREGGDRLVHAGILQGDGQRSVPAHGVASDANLVRKDRKLLHDDVPELLRDVVVHVVVLFVLVRRRVQVEARARPEVVGLRVLVRHIVAARGGVRHHEDEAQLGGALEGASLLREVLVRAR